MRKLLSPLYNLIIILYYFFVDEIVLSLYGMTINKKVAKMRQKPIINVAFVLADLGSWKTESLYIAMKSHPRFNPMIIIHSKDDGNKKEDIIKYVEGNNYPYFFLNNNKSLRKVFKPEIIFYQQPYGYGGEVKRHGILFNLQSLFCYVRYAFNTLEYDKLYKTRLYECAWQVYYENEVGWKWLEKVLKNKGSNSVVTGLPITDTFLNGNFANPWKKQNKEKKKIIWAPHHTISDKHDLHYSTFLEFKDFMLEMADKYKDKVQFTFKPHPFLRNRLSYRWSTEQIDHYYSEWAKRDNTQIEEGEYVGLFMNSDAMIHDCGSFTVEYHYTTNPVLYIEKEKSHADNMNEFGLLAYNLHYKAHSKEDIENFILNVINGIDPLKNKRVDFFNKYLLPPNNNKACDNIINSILGNNIRET